MSMNWNASSVPFTSDLSMPQLIDGRLLTHADERSVGHEAPTSALRMVDAGSAPW